MSFTLTEESVLERAKKESVPNISRDRIRNFDLRTLILIHIILY